VIVHLVSSSWGSGTLVPPDPIPPLPAEQVLCIRHGSAGILRAAACRRPAPERPAGSSTRASVRASICSACLVDPGQGWPRLDGHVHCSPSASTRPSPESRGKNRPPSLCGSGPS